MRDQLHQAALRQIIFNQKARDQGQALTVDGRSRGNGTRLHRAASLIVIDLPDMGPSTWHSVISTGNHMKQRQVGNSRSLWHVLGFNESRAADVDVALGHLIEGLGAGTA